MPTYTFNYEAQSGIEKLSCQVSIAAATETWARECLAMLRPTPENIRLVCTSYPGDKPILSDFAS